MGGISNNLVLSIDQRNKQFIKGTFVILEEWNYSQTMTIFREEKLKHKPSVVCELTHYRVSEPQEVSFEFQETEVDETRGDNEKKKECKSSCKRNRNYL